MGGFRPAGGRWKDRGVVAARVARDRSFRRSQRFNSSYFVRTPVVSEAQVGSREGRETGVSG